MPKNVTLRHARSDEYQLFNGLYAADDRGDFFTPQERLERRREQFAEIDDGRRVVFLAEQDGRVVGGAHLSFDGPEPGTGKISAVAVSPEFRRQGIGTQLMDAAEALAVERGLTAVILYVRGDNEGAVAMYLARGYEMVPQEQAGGVFGGFQMMRKTLAG